MFITGYLTFNFMAAYTRLTQHITSNRLLFPKLPEEYDIITFYGDNIVASEGKEWKRYRKISAPAFSEVCLRNQYTRGKPDIAAA